MLTDMLVFAAFLYYGAMAAGVFVLRKTEPNSPRPIKAFGYPVLPDETNDFLGPLAGFLLGLKHAKHEYVLTVPCDSPLLPHNLAERLYKGMVQSHADISIATSCGETHPVFCLMKKSVMSSLQAFLQNGGCKVSAWQKSQKYVEVDFSDISDAFTNLNTFEDLNRLELKL
jgi:molybdopterin-guanine dinucleotide biosynthesis protein A